MLATNADQNAANGSRCVIIVGKDMNNHCTSTIDAHNSSEEQPIALTQRSSLARKSPSGRNHGGGRRKKP